MSVWFASLQSRSRFPATWPNIAQALSLGLRRVSTMGQYLTRLIQAVMRPVVRLAAKRAARIQAGAGRIDTHIHCLPPAYLAELNKAGVSVPEPSTRRPRHETDHVPTRETPPASQRQNGHPSPVWNPWMGSEPPLVSPLLATLAPREPPPGKGEKREKGEGKREMKEYPRSDSHPQASSQSPPPAPQSWAPAPRRANSPAPSTPTSAP